MRSHSHTVLPAPALASSRPSGLNATPRTEPPWPINVRRCAPVAGSHSRTVLSALQLASSRPSGLNATPRTEPLWPVRVRRCLAVAGSHSRTVLSALQLASSRPSGLNATPRTESVWPVRVRRCAPVAGSHSRTVLSPPQLASSRPSGLNATSKTVASFALYIGVRAVSSNTFRNTPVRGPRPPWPVRVRRCAVVAGSHSRTVLSPPQLASSRPAGLNATSKTVASFALYIGVRAVSSNTFRNTPVRGPRPPWPVRVRRCAVVAGSHSRTVLSPPQLASSRPSRLNATPRAKSVWPVKAWASLEMLAVTESESWLEYWLGLLSGPGPSVWVNLADAM